MNTFARPADGAKDQKPKPKPKPKQDQKPLTLALSRRKRGLIEVFGRSTPTCDTALNSDSETDQKPLTLALSRRERGLTAWTGRDTPTCDPALNSGFETHKSAPSPSGEGWGEGRIHHKTKVEHPLFTTQ
jgi:hypothetical protein